uniref:Uncharacterized protein n=1 Tax=Octopus bimaculoides TaxID=37653 RepID=A0A0L8FYQ2_OCTBM
MCKTTAFNKNCERHLETDSQEYSSFPFRESGPSLPRTNTARSLCFDSQHLVSRCLSHCKYHLTIDSLSLFLLKRTCQNAVTFCNTSTKLKLF